MPALRPTPPHSEFISVHGVRALLGDVSETFVRSRLLDKADPLPAYKLGGRLFFKRSEVHAWVDRQRIERPQSNPPGIARPRIAA